MNSMDRTPEQMKEDALMWSRAGYPQVAVGRYREAAEQLQRLRRETRFTRRIVLHRNGDPIHFDVTVDLARIAEELGPKAERNRSHVSSCAGGFVSVEHIP